MFKVPSLSVNGVSRVSRQGRTIKSRTISKVIRRVGPVFVSLLVLATAMNVSPILTSVSSAAGGVGFNQCANGSGAGPTCSWINGDLQHSNSTYYEGDSTPQRITLSGLSAGSHSVTIQYATTKSGLHAYDFLTSYNSSESWITASDVCSGITGCNATTLATATAAGFAIPVDPSAAGHDSTFAKPRDFIMVGGTITGTSAITTTGSYSGDSAASITVNFTVAAGADVGLFFGAHVANEKDWGLGTGAASINGSPYHVIFAALDNGSVGSRDNQMQANTILTPSISIAKSASVSSYSAAGQPITYSYKVTNTGNTTLNPVVVSDPMAGLSTMSCPNTSLAAGAFETCTATYTTTQNDVNRGSISNTGTATGTPPGGTPVTASSSLTIPGVQTAKLGLTKIDNLNPGHYDHVGQVVTYTLKATNNGNVTLTNVSVSDNPSLAGFSCTPSVPDASLALGASIVCTGTHSVTQADIDNGSFMDTATATSDQTTPITASDTITATQTAVLGLTKTDNLNPSRYNTVGQVVTYTLTATNNGNTTLTNVTVADSPALDSYGCTPSVPVASLAPGASIVCTGTHTVTQADIDNGSFKDTATATSDETTPVTANDTVYANGSAVLGLTKTDNLNPDTYDHVGQVVGYTLTAKNNGNTTLTNVSVSDSPSLDGFNCTPSIPDASLAPGASIVCTGTHTVTQADIDNGSFRDTATATSDETTPVTASDTVYAAQTNVLGLTKTDNLNPDTYDHVGQVVGYTLTATNNGNTTLTNVSVADSPSLDGFSCTPSIPVASLAPGDSIVCTGTHTVTQADLDNGSFKDTATATSTQAPATPANDTVYAAQTNFLGLTKTDNLNPGTYDHVGQVVGYTLTATNSGNTTLTNVSVSDSPSLDGFDCTPSIPDASLAPGDSIVCTGTHAVTQADLDTGWFKDTATATSDETTPVTASDTITANQTVGLGITKTDNLNPDTYDTLGQVVGYTLTATNNGNTTLTNVSVSDSPSLDGFDCTPSIPDASLAPGDSIVCTGTHTITQADLDAGSFVDTATATSDETTPVTASDTIKATQNAVLGLTKTDNLNPSRYDSVGQVVTYTLTATNNGNVTLTNVSVSDNPSLDGFDCTPSIPDASLAPGASIVCTGTHAVTQGDLDNGSYMDTATASSDQTTPVTAPDTVSATQGPAISITKLPASQTIASGGTATWTIVVTNTGDVTLSNVTVTDPLSPNCDATFTGTLAPGASETGYSCSLADVTAGFTNVATASGRPSESDSSVTATASAVVTLSSPPPPPPPPPSASLTTTPTVTGDSATDAATVTGSAGTPTGSVTFTLYSGASGSGTLVSGFTADTVALVGGTATSVSTGNLAAGNYYFLVNFTSGGTYSSLTGTPEPFTIALQSAALATLPTVTGLSATDAATVSGSAGTPTGTVTFTLYSGAPGSGSLVSGFAADTESLASGTATSVSTGTLAAGNYYFMVTYSGDATYSPVTGTAEPFTIIASSPPKTHPKVPPVKIPTKAPQTGAGGAAQGAINGGWLSLSIMFILAGLAAMGFARRRRIA